MNGNKTLNTCFIEACKEKNSEKVKASILLGCDVNCRDEDSSYTGLMLSTGPNFSLDIMEKILQAPGVNVNVDEVHKKQKSWAGMSRQEELEQMYQDEIYDSGMCNHEMYDFENYHRTPRGIRDGGLRAQTMYPVPSTKLPSTNTRTPTEKHGTALHVACYFNQPYAIEVLGSVLDLEVNKKNNAGQTAIMIAVEKGYTECLKALALIPGVDINITGPSGDNPIMIAVEKGYTDCLKALALIPGVDFNIMGRNGDTPIIAALKESNKEIFDFLVEKPEVNLQLRDWNQKTLEQLARESNKNEYLMHIPGTVENKMEILAQKVRSMEATRRVPECPVCLNHVHPPAQMFQCVAGHIVCGDCKPRINVCPTCREPMAGRAHAFEQFLRGDH